MRYAAIFTFALALASASQAEIAWEQNLKAAHARAAAEGKLMLLHFYSDNCGWCDKLEAGAFKSPAVADALANGYVAVKIHGMHNPKLTSMFKVRKYPTDVIVTTDGKALTHQVSPQQPDRYVAMLSGARSRHSQATTVASAPTQPTQAQQTPSPKTPNLPPPTPTVTASATLPPAAATMPPAAATLPVQVPAPAAAVATQTAPVAAPEAGARANEFVLPGKSSTGVSVSLASARTGEASTAKADTTMGATDPAATLSGTSKGTTEPPTAVEGYCAVSVIKNGEWVEGKKEYGVIHLGKLYLFANEDAMKTFLADPMPYTPMLDEIDIVRFFEEKRIVRGKREWGVIDPVHNRMYFFADKEAMIHFEEFFEDYLDAAMEVMDKAVAKANPGL